MSDSTVPSYVMAKTKLFISPNTIYSKLKKMLIFKLKILILQTINPINEEIKQWTICSETCNIVN